MAEKRTALVYATLKRFYKPAELTELLAGSDALYQIGSQVLINVKEAESFIQQFRIYVAAKEIQEAEKRQAKGSRFVRELKQ